MVYRLLWEKAGKGFEKVKKIFRGKKHEEEISRKEEKHDAYRLHPRYKGPRGAR